MRISEFVRSDVCSRLNNQNLTDDEIIKECIRKTEPDMPDDALDSMVKKLKELSDTYELTYEGLSR